MYVCNHCSLTKVTGSNLCWFILVICITPTTSYTQKDLVRICSGKYLLPAHVRRMCNDYLARIKTNARTEPPSDSIEPTSSVRVTPSTVSGGEDGVGSASGDKGGDDGRSDKTEGKVNPGRQATSGDRTDGKTDTVTTGSSAACLCNCAREYFLLPFKEPDPIFIILLLLFLFLFLSNFWDYYHFFKENSHFSYKYNSTHCCLIDMIQVHRIKKWGEKFTQWGMVHSGVARATRRAKMRKKISKVWGKIRQTDQNLRKC